MNCTMKSLHLVINPNAGTRQARRFLPEIISVFNRANYFCSVYVTEKRGDATRFVRKYAGGTDLVVACGGDGTLNEVITGLQLGGHAVPLGYIPCGSTNDFARCLGVPDIRKKAIREKKLQGMFSKKKQMTKRQIKLSIIK